MASWSAFCSRRSRLIKPFVSEELSLQRLTSRSCYKVVCKAKSPSWSGTIERGENKQPRALDRASLDKLQSLTFEPYGVKLEAARDLFLFAYYTGVAYCDMIVLNREHLFTDNEETFVDCQHANQCPNHRPEACKGYGQIDGEILKKKREKVPRRFA